jgi:hypothetical protein
MPDLLVSAGSPGPCPDTDMVFMGVVSSAAADLSVLDQRLWPMVTAWPTLCYLLTRSLCILTWAVNGWRKSEIISGLRKESHFTRQAFQRYVVTGGDWYRLIAAQINEKESNRIEYAWEKLSKYQKISAVR